MKEKKLMQKYKKGARAKKRVSRKNKEWGLLLSWIYDNRS